jgi:hypothetical protein
MSTVVIGLDPHERSATIEMMSNDKTVLGGRDGTGVIGQRGLLLVSCDPAR